MLNAGYWSCDYIIIDEDVADASPHSTVYHVLEEAVMLQKTADDTNKGNCIRSLGEFFNCAN